ncbi:exo-alpha-sialidase [Trypanosoma cruzi]|nr:exo-alpha-sialidase [Trypanosoma cruzi]
MSLTVEGGLPVPSTRVEQPKSTVLSVSFIPTPTKKTGPLCGSSWIVTVAKKGQTCCLRSSTAHSAPACQQATKSPAPDPLNVIPPSTPDLPLFTAAFTQRYSSAHVLSVDVLDKKPNSPLVGAEPLQSRRF